MSAESSGAAVGANASAPVARANSRLGVTAFALAVFFSALPWLVTLVFVATSTGGSSYTGIAMVAYVLHLLGMLAALTLGILAVVNRRGRGWGIAAIVVGILFSQTVVTAVAAMFGALAA